MSDVLKCECCGASDFSPPYFVWNWRGRQTDKRFTVIECKACGGEMEVQKPLEG